MATGVHIFEESYTHDVVQMEEQVVLYVYAVVLMYRITALPPIIPFQLILEQKISGQQEYIWSDQ